MPKKSKGAFFFYMLDFKKQEARRGKHYPGGISSAALKTAASKSWENMNVQQKGPFIKQAKDDKFRHSKEVEKFTSQGIPVSQIERKQEEEVVAKRTMEKTIKEIVNNAYINNTMGSQEYYFIAGNYFCKINDGPYIPAELAIIKFTFESGIVSKFHTYINPGTLPLGYHLEAKEYSAMQHGLPIPPDALGEKNYQRILEQINQFMGNSRSFPLFTLKENIPMIESFMRDFHGGNDEDLYRIYPLHQLFFDIKEEAGKNSITESSFKSVHVAEYILKREYFNYLQDTACNYHEELDQSMNCALSYVQRWVYIFLENICTDLQISLIPGKHIPQKSN